MDWSPRLGRIIAVGTLLIVASLAAGGLSLYGIWDPWELAAADLARQISAGDDVPMTRPFATAHFIATGFAWFGVEEWAGRLPIAFAGIVAVALGYLLSARFAGRRTGVLTMLIAGTSPLFLFNSRSMLGASVEIAATTGVFVFAMVAVFLPRLAPGGPPKTALGLLLLRLRPVAPGFWIVGLAVSAWAAAEASGILVGVAPPMLAVAIVVLARREVRPRWRFFSTLFKSARRSPRAIIALAAFAAGLLIAAISGAVVWADYADYGIWTGGVPRGGNPPGWEQPIERLFHSFAPWSAVLPLALATLLSGRRPSAVHKKKTAPRPAGALAAARHPAAVVSHAEENALRLAVVAWVAFGYVAQTIYTARLGPTTFLPLIGASVAVALFLRDVERSSRPYLAAGLISLLFVGLIARDLGQYPSGPIEGLPVEGLEIPEVFATGTPDEQMAGVRTPPKILAYIFLVFGLLLGLGLAADPRDPLAELRRDIRGFKRSLRAKKPLRIVLSVFRFAIPVRLIANQWRRGWGYRIWLVLLAALGLATSVGFGVAAYVFSAEILASSEVLTEAHISIGKRLAFLPLYFLAAVLGATLVRVVFVKLGSYRLAPAFAMSLCIAAFVAFSFQPALSSHFSPREVYDTYNRLATAEEPLGEYRVGGRAAEYYATGVIEELDSQRALLDFLQNENRVWAAFRADDLAAINRDYRRVTHRHLFIADARSARMVLATNQPVAGRANQNYLAETVLSEPPANIQHPTDISFDERVVLIGYDLDLPNGNSVGTGQAFTITWYLQVIAPVPGSYQPFVHIDGPGQRINGDHQPVGGRYPMRLWEAGDIVVDRQELRVPADCGRSDLIIYLGFFSGEQRLEVVRGPEDDANRGRAGILRVR